VTRARRVALGVVALALSAAATAVAPEPPSGGGLLRALGQSLGGFRVLVVDVLFLRAEALRREGRIDEVPALHRAVLELDPGNEAAFEHLASVHALDLRFTVPEPEQRRLWWLEGWDAIERGLAAHPRSSRLLGHGAILLFSAAREPEMARGLPPPPGPALEAAAIDHLARAVRLGDPAEPRHAGHVWFLAAMAPQWAAGRLVTDPASSASLLALGEEVLARERDLLDRMRLPPAGEEDPSAIRAGPPLSRWLRAALDVVVAVGDARAQRRWPEARAALRAYAAEWPDSPLLLSGDETPPALERAATAP
jgi:hypothetical protein